MAYFGRRPEKPGSVPGAGSGSEFAATRQLVGRLVRAARRGAGPRPERQGHRARAGRAGRAGRTGRRGR